MQSEEAPPPSLVQMFLQANRETLVCFESPSIRSDARIALIHTLKRLKAIPFEDIENSS